MAVRTVHAVVDGSIRLPVEQLAPKALALLERRLTFPNPEYLSRARFGQWTGATPEEITLVDHEQDGTIRVPRGAVGILREVLSNAGRRISFDDRRAVCPSDKLKLQLDLRDYQARAAAALVRHVQGCVVIPCGGGKTIIGAAAIAEAGRTALIIVHTRDLLEQWRSSLRAALNVEAGVIAEGKVEPGAVTVATVQTLTSFSTTKLADIGAGFGLVIVDEAHHVPAATFRQVLAALPGKYRFGLTATPERADGLTPLLELCIGPVLFQMTHKELVEAGHLIIPKIEPIMTGYVPTAEKHAAIVSELIRETGRNDRILELATREASEGRTILILSSRVEHCVSLAEKLLVRGVSAEALTGRVPKADRKRILEQLRSGKTKIVCATSLADEGLDVSNLERLILATPARAEGRTIQRFGRLMRPHPGKAAPILYDLVDDAPMTRRQWTTRKRAYRKVLGGTFTTNGACAWGTE